MILESLFHPFPIFCMLRCLGLRWPWKLGPSFPTHESFLASPQTRHTRSSGWKARGWTFVLYLLVAQSLVASSLILTISWTSSIVSSSTLIFSSFFYCWNNNLLVDGPPTSTEIMTYVPHVSCHTLISSGEYYLMTCNLWLAALRYLASFVAQYMKSQDVSEIKRK